MHFISSVISKAKASFSDTEKQLTNKKGHENLNCLTELTMYKVASFKRSQYEGCSIIIHLMALHDYYLKYIQGRHIKHTLKLFI